MNELTVKRKTFLDIIMQICFYCFMVLHRECGRKEEEEFLDDGFESRYSGFWYLIETFCQFVHPC